MCGLQIFAYKEYSINWDGWNRVWSTDWGLDDTTEWSSYIGFSWGIGVEETKTLQPVAFFIDLVS